MKYSAPSVSNLGSLQDMTLDLNKVGKQPDIYSEIVPIVGDQTFIS